MSDINAMVQDFERSRVQLAAIEQQGQSLRVQVQVLDETLKELKESKETKVYKAVGNILLLSDRKKVEREIADQKESLELRVKTVKKQEDVLLEKLKKLKSEIESAQKPKSKEAKEPEEE